MKLEGKRAVITGGSSGIGLATARLFIEEGASVAILGRNQARLEAALETLGDRATAIVADVAEPNTVATALGKVAERFAGIDILFATLASPRYRL
jgi:NAD(P)-dependent dehydrogenase (short-subunit alcohol dehydrogenase family)